MSINKAFDQWLKKDYQEYNWLSHKIDCSYKTSPAPINECTCNCYEYQLFKAGYFAAKGIKLKKMKN